MRSLVSVMAVAFLATVALGQTSKTLPLEIRSKLEASLADCPSDANQRIETTFRVSRADLTGKGTREFVVQAKNQCLCGATGNCAFWIFEVKDGRVTALLETDLVQTWAMLATRSHGFKDLRVSAHSSVSESEVRYYRFDGKRYRQHICENWRYAELDGNGNLVDFKNPKKTLVQCMNEGDK